MASIFFFNKTNMKMNVNNTEVYSLQKDLCNVVQNISLHHGICFFIKRINKSLAKHNRVKIINPLE